MTLRSTTARVLRSIVECRQGLQRTFKTKSNQTMVQVTPIPILEDNYAYFVLDQKSKTAAVVDPAEPAKVVPALRKLLSDAGSDARLVAILTTHHHTDHAGGNVGLLEAFPGTPVYGADDRVPGLTNKLSHGDSFRLGDSVTVKGLLTPCHTRGSVSFYCESQDGAGPARFVFTGDTLFVGGCGRFFEGTADEMYKALVKTLGSLPHETAVYCGHEYTVSNLVFAQHVEPANDAVASKLAWARSTSCTVPSTIRDEFEINPFMRVEKESVLQKLGVSDPIQAMDLLRTQKNNFRA